MISTILVIGGTPMLPGFIPRLHQELIRSLNKTPAAPSIRSPKRRAYDPFEPVRPLAPYVAILNNPSPPPSTSSSSQNAGKAPAFSPSCMAWVGGSLAG
jgi:actin-related protein 10